MISSTVIADKTIGFKQPFSLHYANLSYGLVLIILLIIALLIAKRHKPRLTQKSICHVVEKKYLSNKTIVYIIDYQQQRFLLADNQQALALHQLRHEVNDETV